MNRITKAVVIAIGGVLLGGSLLGTGAASASGGSETVYLQAMNNAGFTIYDTNWAISTGYHICSMLSYEDGNAAARDVFHISSWHDVPDLSTAALWVNTAATTLCPWTWDNGSVTSQYLA